MRHDHDCSDGVAQHNARAAALRWITAICVALWACIAIAAGRAL